MIKCYVNKNNHKAPVSVDVTGTIEELVDDIGNIAHTLYPSLKEDDPEYAKEFKAGIQEIFADGGPAWMTCEELLEED